MPNPLNEGNWVARAECATADPDELFVQGAAQRSARAICQRCDVRLICLADALDNRMEYGVWGGMTERERRALLRKRPDVECWKTFFSAPAEHMDHLAGSK